MSANRPDKGRVRRTLLLAAAAALALLVVIGGGTVVYAGQPTFCASCHLMETRYVSWQRSAHGAKATCLQCHSEPGSTGELRARLNAAHYLYVSATGAKAGTVISATVEDGACLGCHPSDRLPARVGDHDIAHAIHLGEGISCTTCHAGLAHGTLSGTAVKPAMATCQECHSSKMSAALSDCSSCHRETQAGFVGRRSPGVQPAGGR